MNILITGGAGFIGSALANRLYADGHDVHVLDDGSNGDVSRLSDGVPFTEGSVTDIPLLWSLLPDVACVYHLAARVSVAESMLYPSQYNTVNVGGTVSLMEAVRDTGVKRVVFASSGAVYGDCPQQPIAELVPPRPTSPYAVSKWAAEQYLFTIGRIHAIETAALRIFNVYGVGQPSPVSHAPVIPRFLQNILTGGSVVIFGNGTQSRDFVYVDDVVAGLKAAAAAQNINQQIINIGSGEETTLNQLIATLEKVTGKKAKPLTNKLTSGGVQRLWADISKARKLLGYTPMVGLEEGVKRIINNQ